MEDLRVQKTKKKLKAALTALVREQPFEHITVAELCRRANVSRITFYTHYGDKYELADSFFEDLISDAQNHFLAMQRQNNPGDDPAVGYHNLVRSILELYFTNFEFFQDMEKNENHFLDLAYYRYIMPRVELFAGRYSRALPPRSSFRKEISFLCYGLWGFLRMGRLEGSPWDSLRREATALAESVLENEFLMGPAPAYPGAEIP